MQLVVLTARLAELHYGRWWWGCGLAVVSSARSLGSRTVEDDGGSVDE